MKIFIIILCFLFYINNLAQAKCAFNCSDANSKKVLKKTDAIKLYEINIPKAFLKNLKRSPIEFDFSSFKILQNKEPIFCNFNMYRYEFEPEGNYNPKQKWAQGTIKIDNGKIIFLSGSWIRIGGFASNDMFKTNMNLMLTKKGEIKGKMIFFTHRHRKGKIAKPGKYVTIDKKLKKFASLPSGEHNFFLNSWSEGRIEIKYCKVNGKYLGI